MYPVMGSLPPPPPPPSLSLSNRSLSPRYQMLFRSLSHPQIAHREKALCYFYSRRQNNVTRSFSIPLFNGIYTVASFPPFQQNAFYHSVTFVHICNSTTCNARGKKSRRLFLCTADTIGFFQVLGVKMRLITSILYRSPIRESGSGTCPLRLAH